MLVVGAGVVGMACARALQRAGHRVCVADPQAPGSGCSAGNAGVIASDHVMPLACPATLARLPALLVRRHGPLYLKASRLPGLLPWFLRFAAAALPDRAARGSTAIAALTSRSLPAWRRELAASGAEDLLCARGLYAVYRSARGFAQDAPERALARRLGVEWEALDGDALGEREPALAPEIRRAAFYPGVAHVLEPRRLVERLTGAFSAAGGDVLGRRVTDLTSRAHQVTATLDGGTIRCRYVVVAAGMGARALCRTVGCSPPLAAEMGYHLTFPGEQGRLSAPVAVAESGFIATPMAGHLRLAGTVEFARRESAPAWGRARVLATQAARLFRTPLPEPGGRWRGSRPTLPDYLPAIGALPGHPRVLAAFGHQHMGLTTAAVTGEIIRDLVAGQAPAVDVAPYAPGRFARSL